MEVWYFIMKIIFKTNDIRVLIFNLDIENKKMISVDVIKGQESMANIYYPNFSQASYVGLERILNRLVGNENFSLIEHLNYIKENQFRTPYMYNLRIDIED